MTTADELIKRAGLRSTAPRRAVLDMLLTRPHLTAPELASALPATLSHQGLYNVLDDLRRAGIVRSFEPAGSIARYETRVGDNHHHLVCRDCGKITDVDCAIGMPPCLTPIDDAGFSAIDEAEVTWWGTCTTCTESQKGQR
ncbi:fur family transcriptional regulator FurA3 [Winogradskya consettensis]|uniref:Transcriptional repressor n=1 Tax=Winogradskya consettensis TaxID=113560 RepID=A0A919W098_9ACTN|nr:Fur family transcriptional regulator [Actinoplanes consettensis]GIM81286.1 transcriptional repressor [Actinoplanes consettensis]